MQARIHKGGWTAQSVRAFAEATRPRITVQRPRLHAPVPPAEGESISLSRIAHFEVRYPTLIERTEVIPNGSLAVVLEAIRHNLELGTALEAEISRFHQRLPTLYPEDVRGEHYYSDSEQYYITFAQLFSELCPSMRSPPVVNSVVGITQCDFLYRCVSGHWPIPI